MKSPLDENAARYIARGYVGKAGETKPAPSREGKAPRLG